MPVKQPTEPTDEWMRRFLMSMTDDLYVELTEYVEHQVGRGQAKAELHRCSSTARQTR